MHYAINDIFISRLTMTEYDHLVETNQMISEYAYPRHQLIGSLAKCARCTKLTILPMCTLLLHRDLTLDESRQENVDLKKALLLVL